MPKPEWLKIRITTPPPFKKVDAIVHTKRLHTVCEEALCPNRFECWGRGTATFLILGDICTRSCGFCAVKTGRPEKIDEEEPFRVAQSVQAMGLKYAVITSVNRDERPDGGADIWAKTIEAIRQLNPDCGIEVLIPDFKGDKKALDRVIQAKPDVFAHNLETVPRLYKKVRPQADYRQSLEVLRYGASQGLTIKTGIMVGLGETDEEIYQVMADSVNQGVSIFTIGQYLQPTLKHLPVERYVPPTLFQRYCAWGEALGFRKVISGPLVRSSYHAEEAVSFGSHGNL